MQASRRVMTGIIGNKSAIVADEIVEDIHPYDSFPSFLIQNLFYTEDFPQSIKTRHVATPYNRDLPKAALRFVKIRMPTLAEKIADFQNTGQDIPEDWTKFNLQSTGSADYIYILSGEVTCVVGEEQLHLKTGDFLAQIGAEHTWINDHDQPCYMLCVMIGRGDSEAGLI